MDLKLYEDKLNEYLEDKFNQGYIEITTPEDKADILSRLFLSSGISEKRAAELFSQARVVSGVVLVNPIPGEDEVYVERVAYWPNDRLYDCVMEDAHEYAPNQKIKISPISSDAEVFYTSLEAGVLTTEEMDKIKKTTGYKYYSDNLNKKDNTQPAPKQPGATE